MVSTRSKNGTQAQAGDKRSTSTKNSGSNKKAKKETATEIKEKKTDGKLVAEDGQLGLKKDDESDGNGEKEEKAEKKKEQQKDDSADSKAESKAKETSPVGSDNEPKHGTLESGHIYFLYRPKVEVEDASSIDDVSKFHILLIPKSKPYGGKHFHRIIEVGKKKLPDPGAKHQVIWGLVSGVGEDKSSLKDTFGAYEYDTKTRGRRHQGAARPAARGHYILHSPQDELADSPEHDRKRDFKMILAYEITTPHAEDFGKVQEDLGLAPKSAIVLQVKDPNVESRGNPRAAGIPRDKRAQYSTNLQNLFENRRFIPCNPPSFLSYSGTELLLISSPHKLHESLGKDGEAVEDDLDHVAEDEMVGVEGALDELGLNKVDFDEDALEGSWT